MNLWNVNSFHYWRHADNLALPRAVLPVGTIGAMLPSSSCHPGVGMKLTKPRHHFATLGTQFFHKHTT